MGFSSQRQSSARTVLRARLIGDPAVIDDAENAVSGYLEEDLDSYLESQFPEGLAADDAVVKLVQERDRFKSAAIQTQSEIHDVLAEALGYPEFQPGEPGHSPDKRNWSTGDHVAESLASEAARKIQSLETELAAQRAVADAVRTARANHPACKEHPDDDVISCGWKRAVRDIDAALAGAERAAPEE